MGRSLQTRESLRTTRIAMTLREFIQRRYDQWLAEDTLNAPKADAVEVALAEVTADGITKISELIGFDLEGIWER